MNSIRRKQYKIKQNCIKCKVCNRQILKNKKKRCNKYNNEVINDVREGYNNDEEANEL